jgi:hypothetical protein
MSQNKNAGALHVYRTDTPIRLPDAGNLGDGRPLETLRATDARNAKPY